MNEAIKRMVMVNRDIATGGGIEAAHFRQTKFDQATREYWKDYHLKADFLLPDHLANHVVWAYLVGEVNRQRKKIFQPSFSSDDKTRITSLIEASLELTGDVPVSALVGDQLSGADLRRDKFLQRVGFNYFRSKGGDQRRDEAMDELRAGKRDRVMWDDVKLWGTRRWIDEDFRVLTSPPHHGLLVYLREAQRPEMGDLSPTYYESTNPGITFCRRIISEGFRTFFFPLLQEEEILRAGLSRFTSYHLLDTMPEVVSTLHPDSTALLTPPRASSIIAS